MATIFEIRYETRGGRCAWCWKDLPVAETHTVVEAVRAPPLRLDFHHACWEAYRTVSEVELKAVGSSRRWPPERVEELRITAGLDRKTFARELGLADDTYLRFLDGDDAALGPGASAKVRKLAAAYRFEDRSFIDWSDTRAFFCLRMHLGASYREMAAKLNASDQQVPRWDRDGVPRRSVRTWGRLSRLARKAGFEAALIVDDRAWTPERLRAAVAASGRDPARWAGAAGCSTQAVRQWLNGTRPIHREAAWRLTRAASDLGVSIPPVGRVGYRQGHGAAGRKPPSAEDEARRLARVAESGWSLDDLTRLGTVPDRVLADRLGKSKNSVAIMRRGLGIPALDARGWDGRTIDQALPLEEVRRRRDAYRDQLRDRARESRQADDDRDS